MSRGRSAGNVAHDHPVDLVTARCRGEERGFPAGVVSDGGLGMEAGLVVTAHDRVEES